MLWYIDKLFVIPIQCDLLMTRTARDQNFFRYKKISFNIRTWSLYPPHYTGFLKTGLRYALFPFKTSFAVHITLKWNVLNTSWLRSCGLRSPSWCTYDKLFGETCCFYFCPVTGGSKCRWNPYAWSITHWITT